MKVAIIHYWLVNMRGGERVIEAICEMYPEADIFTHVYVPESVSDTIRKHKIFTTFIQKLPWSAKLYQNYLPLMPLAIEQLDLRGYDLVISSESGPAKGVIVDPEAKHLCYCHSPMRYLWDMYPDYLAASGWFKRLLIPVLTHYLRHWDRSTSTGVDVFVANSHFVAKRIKRYYGRNSIVIPPPVDTGSFVISNDIGDHYLMLGQLVSYKRPDLAVAAFKESGRKLVVIGEGEMLDSLKDCNCDNIIFLGKQPNEVVQRYLTHCRALIFPGMEDFGIVPVEAMAAGRPVIAYGRGGALDSVVDGKTGVFFDVQSPEALNAAIDRFENQCADFVPQAIAEHAAKFGKENFKSALANAINKLISA